MPSPYKNERDIQRIKNHSGKEPPETFVEIQKIATQVNNIPSPFVMTITDTALKMHKNRFYVVYNVLICALLENYKDCGYFKYINHLLWHNKNATTISCGAAEKPRKEGEYFGKVLKNGGKIS